VAFATAKYWDILPHILWHYPFRYYKELRDFYIAASRPAPVASDDDSIDFDINAEMFKGDAI
jgi:hypothetical protein